MRKKALLAELAQLEEQAKAAEIAARDAGRPVLLSALERVKIAALDKAHAKTIASAIGTHGGAAVAEHLTALNSA
jgi:hypothetical protein